MEIHFVLITLGGLFLIGLATDELGRRTRLPRVTLLILFGVLIGPAGLDILPHTPMSASDPKRTLALPLQHVEPTE